MVLAVDNAASSVFACAANRSSRVFAAATSALDFIRSARSASAALIWAVSSAGVRTWVATTGGLGLGLGPALAGAAVRIMLLTVRLSATPRIGRGCVIPKPCPTTRHVLKSLNLRISFAAPAWVRDVIQV